MLDKVRNLQLGGHVGFDSLPDQLVNKSVQKGFVFNILCIGKQLSVVTTFYKRSIYYVKIVYIILHL